MTAPIFALPLYPVFFDLKGQPLEAGFIYIGAAGANAEASPVSVWWDEAMTLPAVQPIRTVSGYPDRNGSAAAIYTAGDYSITVRDKKGQLVYSSRNGVNLAEAATAEAQEAADFCRSLAFQEAFSFSTVAGTTFYALAFDPGAQQLILDVNGLVQTPGTHYNVVSVSGVVGVEFVDPITQSGDLVTYRVARAYTYDPNLNRVENLRTRPALVTHIDVNGAILGQIYSDGTRLYRTIPVDHVLYGTDPISDLPGLMPFDQITAGHFAPNANGAVTINEAIAYADGIGGGDVWILGTWEVQYTGTFSTSNGDNNACVRVNTTNPVTLRGYRWLSRIVQTDTKVAHIVAFGVRVGANVTAKPGGLRGIEIVGNRATAISEAVPFEGGHGVYVTTPGSPAEASLNIFLDDFTVMDTWSYGVAFQRAAWTNCVVSNFLIQDTGNDGIDCKQDWPDITDATGSNWVRNGIIRRPGLRYADLVGQKAGADLRIGWNISEVYVETTAPVVGIRLQPHDQAVGSADDPSDTIYRQTVIGCKVVQSGTITGSDAALDALYAFGYQFGTSFVTAHGLNADGGHTNYRIRSNGGSYHGLVGRGASDTGLAVISMASSTANNNAFFGGEFSGAGTQDILVDGQGADVDATEFHGVKCGTMVLESDSTNTSIFGGVQTTVTDSGVNTMRLGAKHIGAFKAGRNSTQYMEVSGDSLGNYLTGIGGSKPTVIRGGSGATSTIIDAPSGNRISLRINNSEIFSIGATGDIRAFGLPTSAPATSGRLWRDAGAGNVIKVVP